MKFLLSIDNDVCWKSISKIYDMYSDDYKILFGNGGDQLLMIISLKKVFVKN